MSKARDIASAIPAPSTVNATELGYLDGVTSAIQTQIDSKEATLPSQTGNSGKYLTTDGSAKSWATVSQYALPSQTGNSGKFLTTNGTAESWGSSGITWTSRVTADSYPFNQIAYNGTNLYVAVGNNGKIYSSSDAKTWTSRTSQFSTSTITDIAFGNGLWVAVGAAGKISTSTDGTTWTARTANMSTNQINSVTYDNSLWVAVGDGGGSTNTGGIIYSSDGITWTRKSQTTTTGTRYYNAAWNGTNWLVGADPSSNNYLYATTPSGTWTSASTGSGAAVGLIVWDGTRNIVLDGTTIGYSTSATMAGFVPYQTAGAYPGPMNITVKRKHKFYSNKLYRFGMGIQSVNIVSNEYPSCSDIIPIPTNYQNVNTDTISGACQSGFVGSIGYIVTDAYGNLYTSF